MDDVGEIAAILHRRKAAGWSVGDTASHRAGGGVTWLVFGWMPGVGENRIEARAGGLDHRVAGCGASGAGTRDGRGVRPGKSPEGQGGS